MVNIATRVTQALSMPDGNRYEFFGRTYFGTCSTAGSTQTKSVSITGFTSTSLVDGVRVVVEFTQAQTYNGIPKLNVSNTGAKSICSDFGKQAGQYEWGSYSVISFVYYSGYWVIEGGQHSSTSNYGVTKLSSTISSDETTALTPKAVNDAGYLTSYTETDPTVPAWAKESTKPSYTASEVGAVPTSRTVNGKALSSNISLTASDVGALPDNTVITDEKLKTDTINSNNQYYPILGNYTSNAETKYICTDFRFRKNSSGITEIQLGQVSDGSTQSGQLVLCSGAHYTYLKPPLYSSISSNVTYTLPDSTGTLALVSEIPQVYSSTNLNGYLTMATLPIYDGTVV